MYLFILAPLSFCRSFLNLLCFKKFSRYYDCEISGFSLTVYGV